MSVDNGENPQGAGDGGVEANLDIQYTLGTIYHRLNLAVSLMRAFAGIATGVPIQFLSAGVHNTTFEDFVQDALDTITFLEGAEDPPTVVSISYGSREDDFGRAFATSVHFLKFSVALAEARVIRSKICDALQGLTARGMSVLVASGDVS